MKIFKNKKLFLISLFLLFLFLISFNAWAGYEIEVGLPDTAKGTPLTLTDYLRKIYLIGLGAVGVAALLMMVISGFVYMLSDTVTSKEKARDYIVGAISGLVLALSSYLILYTINPDLVNWKLELFDINVSEIEPGGVEYEYTWRSCSKPYEELATCCESNETLTYATLCGETEGAGACCVKVKGVTGSME